MAKLIEVAFCPGDTVYVTHNGKVQEMVVEFIYINPDGGKRYHARDGAIKFNFREKNIGRCVFDNYGDAMYTLWKKTQEG